MFSRPVRVLALCFCGIVTPFLAAPRLLEGTNVQEILSTQKSENLRTENIASYIHKPWQSSSGQVDWSRFAYTQYATTEEYLCNSVMLFEALDRLGSKADRLLIFPQEWSGQETLDETADLLRRAQSHGAKLQPIDIVRRFSDNRKHP